MYAASKLHASYYWEHRACHRGDIIITTATILVIVAVVAVVTIVIKL